jgi:hypothetical protein
LAESVARRAAVEGTLSQQLYRRSNGVNHTAAEAMAAYASVDELPDQHHHERNGKTHTAFETALLPTLVEDAGQGLHYERNGGDHSALTSLAVHALVEDADQRQTESEGDQGNLSPSELTIITPLEDSSSIYLIKRIVQAKRHAKRTGRKLLKTSH